MFHVVNLAALNRRGFSLFEVADFVASEVCKAADAHFVDGCSQMTIAWGTYEGFLLAILIGWPGGEASLKVH